MKTLGLIKSNLHDSKSSVKFFKRENQQDEDLLNFDNFLDIDIKDDSLKNFVNKVDSPKNYQDAIHKLNAFVSRLLDLVNENGITNGKLKLKDIGLRDFYSLLANLKVVAEYLVNF